MDLETQKIILTFADNDPYTSMIANCQPLKQTVFSSGFIDQLRFFRKPSNKKQNVEGKKLNSTGDDNALPPVNTGLILKRRYGGNAVISPERCASLKKANYITERQRSNKFNSVTYEL